MVLKKINGEEWIRFCAMSAAIGRDKSLVQGAGGNVSLKEQDVLWVKASGKWLSDAEGEEIFVPLTLELARERALSDSEDFASCALDGIALKPSIETGMHALLPHRVVLHVHSVNALCHAVLRGGEEDMKALLGDIAWRWIPYARPGAPLIAAIRARIDMDSRDPIVLILANHGLVVAADAIDDAVGLLKRVEACLQTSARSLSATEQDGKRLDTLAARIGGKLPKDRAPASLALDPIALDVARRGPLYPDHVVFLGAAPAIRTLEEMDGFDWADSETPYVIIERIGSLVSDGITDNAEAMLACWADVAVRITEVDRLAPLPEPAILELTGWDAEKYRQSLSRTRPA